MIKNISVELGKKHFDMVTDFDNKIRMVILPKVAKLYTKITLQSTIFRLGLEQYSKLTDKKKEKVMSETEEIVFASRNEEAK